MIQDIVQDEKPYDREDFLSDIMSGKVPKTWPYRRDNDMDNFDQLYYDRKVCLASGMFAIVAQDWVDEILVPRLRGNTCLEIMAGWGWLSRALSNSHIDIISTDDYSWRDEKKFNRLSQAVPIHDIEHLNARYAIQKYQSSCDVLIMSWPPYNDTSICEALNYWPKHKPIYYIGEDEYGCTGCPSLYDMISIEREISIPNWIGLYDNLKICYRKNKYHRNVYIP